MQLLITVTFILRNLIWKGRATATFICALLAVKISQDGKLSLSTIQGDNWCEIEGKVGIIKNILKDPFKNAYTIFEE